MTLKYADSLMVFALTVATAHSQSASENREKKVSDQMWRFAVSGNSRNCGDVVMPAIAKKARKDDASFYWHLGDFRAIYDLDQDLKKPHSNSNISEYESSAWPDFIEQQLTPFGDLPVYLGLGNHETIPPKFFLRCFALLRHAFAIYPPTGFIRSSQRSQDEEADVVSPPAVG